MTEDAPCIRFQDIGGETQVEVSYPDYAVDTNAFRAVVHTAVMWESGKHPAYIRKPYDPKTFKPAVLAPGEIIIGDPEQFVRLMRGDGVEPSPEWVKNPDGTDTYIGWANGDTRHNEVSPKEKAISDAAVNGLRVLEVDASNHTDAELLKIWRELAGLLGHNRFEPYTRGMSMFQDVPKTDCVRDVRDRILRAGGYAA